MKSFQYCVFFVLFVMGYAATGAVYYWDPEGSAAESAAGLTGTWSTNAQWSTSGVVTASPTAWVPGYAACFCAGSTTVTTPFIVSVNSPMSIAGIYNGSLTPPGVFVTLSGTGSLNLVAGADAFDTGGTDGGSTTVAVPLTGPGEVAFEGSAQVYFNATNTFTGGTSLGFAGLPAFTSTIHFTNGAAFGSGPILMTASGAGCTMAVEGAAPITLSNAVAATSSSLNITANPAGLTFGGPWTLPATPMIGAGGTGNLIVIAGTMSGTAGFTKYGASTIVLSGTNSYSGVTTISNGVLSVTADANLGTAPNAASYNIFLNGGILNASNTFVLNPKRSISLSGSSSISISSGNSLGDGGAITGAGSLAKTGSGTLILSGGNGYTGTTTIAAGTLEADSQSGSSVGVNAVTVQAGATLSGSGLVGGAVSGTGTIAPGTAAGPATLTLAKGLNLSGGGTYAWNLSANSAAGGFSAISLIGGNLKLGGTSALSIGFGGTASPPATTNPFWQTQEAWPIISVTGSALNSNLTQFASIVNGNYAAGTFTNYSDGSGNINLLYQPNFPVFDSLYDAGPGFFGGENLILTNFSGLSLFVWSSTDAALSVSNWTLVGPMAEQSLAPAQAGLSRYAMNVQPTLSPTYYVAGNMNSGSFIVSPIPVSIVTTPDFADFTVDTTNVAIGSTGTLDLVPAPIILPGSGFSSGQFQFQFNGPVNQSYLIQASTDLVTWTNIGSGTVSASPTTFTGPAAANFPYQFYRVALP